MATLPIKYLPSKNKYITLQGLEYYHGRLIDDISNQFSNCLEYFIETDLPEIGTEGVLYLVPKTDGSGTDNYDEYMWINSKWEKVGGGGAELTFATDDEIDALFASSGGGIE